MSGVVRRGVVVWWCVGWCATAISIVTVITDHLDTVHRHYAQIIQRHWLSHPNDVDTAGLNASSPSCPQDPWCSSGCTATLVQSLSRPSRTSTAPPRACSFHYNSHSSYAEFEAARATVAKATRVESNAAKFPPPGLSTGGRVHYVTFLREPVSRVLSEYKVGG